MPTSGGWLDKLEEFTFLISEDSLNFSVALSMGEVIDLRFQFFNGASFK